MLPDRFALQRGIPIGNRQIDKVFVLPRFGFDPVDHLRKYTIVDVKENNADTHASSLDQTSADNIGLITELGGNLKDMGSGLLVYPRAVVQRPIHRTPGYTAYFGNLFACNGHRHLG